MSMHTEDEAKKLWCPMVRTPVDDSGNGCNRDGYIAPVGNCLASGCAMWRWNGHETTIAVSEKRAAELLGQGYEFTHGKTAFPHHQEMRLRPDLRTGFCGLAGRPDHG